MARMLEEWAARLGADSTKQRYVMYCNKFFVLNGTTPEESLKWTVEEAEDAMLRWRDHLVAQHFAGKTIRVAWSAVRRWFLDHRTRVMVQLKGIRTDKTWLSYIPTREDVRLLLNECDLRYRCLVALLAFSGFRQSDAISLQYQHIRASYEAGDAVLTIIKRQEKSHEWFFTFLGPQGTGYIREFLELRRRRGEVITDRTYIVSKTGRPMKLPTAKEQLQHLIAATVGRHPTNEPFRKFTPHALRKFFRRTVSVLGESVAEFLMGHSAGIVSLTATYAGLRDLDAQAIASLKTQYIKLLPQLETEMTDLSLRTRIDELEAREAEFKAMKAEQEAMQEEMRRISEVLDKYGKKE
jgi:integrase